MDRSYRPWRTLASFLLLFSLLGALAQPDAAQARRLHILHRRSTPSEAPRSTESHRRTAAEPASTRTFEDWATHTAQAEQSLNESWTARIEDLDTSATVFEYHPTRKLAPASNRKLITFGMALETLGPDYKFETELGLTQAIESNSAHYHGDVVLRSNGDPSLMDPFLHGGENPANLLRAWALALHNSGVAYLHGNLIVDATAFGADQNQYPESWTPAHRNYSYAPIPSALAMYQNLVKVSISPASRAGQPGRVSLYPFDGGIAIVNNTHTSARGGGVSAVFGGEDSSSATLVLSGSVRRGGLEVAEIPLPHPLQYIGEMLRESILDAGIRPLGSLVIQTGLTGEPAPKIVQRLGAHESPTLAQIMYPMMQKSNNFMAEQIWRAAAARVTGTGDITNARKVEQDWYLRHGLAPIESGWDGSGLSRKDQFSASEMIGVIKAIYGTAYRSVLLATLPVSGRTGTMRHHSNGTVAGRIAAKTGTLKGASALTGFILDRQGAPRLAFSVIGNAGADTNGRLSTRALDLLTIAVNHLDADIAAGRRPATVPNPLAGLAPASVTAPPGGYIDDDITGESAD